MSPVTQAEPSHVPVLLDEVIASLAIRPGETHVDGTFGAGGYTRAILAAEKALIERTAPAIIEAELSAKVAGKAAEKAALAAANAWMVVPPEVEHLPAGALVEVWPLWGQEPAGTGAGSVRVRP